MMLISARSDAWQAERHDGIHFVATMTDLLVCPSAAHHSLYWYSSAVPRVPLASTPPVTSTRPSFSRVAV
jgi:hypothetical protein